MKSNNSLSLNLDILDKDVSSLRNVSLPTYMTMYLSRCSILIDNAVDLYPDLVKSTPVGLPIPSLNEWLYYFNISKCQSILGDIYSGILILKDKIKELDEAGLGHDDKEYRRCWNIYQDLQSRYTKLSTDLLKFQSSGLDRESRENQTEKILDRINLSDLHRKIVNTD